jgi:DNA recombination protein RmuC
MTTAIYILAALLAGLAAGAFILFAFRQKTHEPQESTALALDMLQKSVQSLSTQISTTLSDTSRSVGERLDNTTRVVGDVRQQLGQLEQASRRVIQIGEDMSKLQDLLKPPKLRGSLGELFLKDLLAQVLPSDNFRVQHKFRGGEQVDAVIILSNGIVPVDAKFPLENFRKFVEAASDDEKKSARKLFVRDVKSHVDAISSKYIRTDEQTLDFALMYIPAENVYYETIIKDEDFSDEGGIFHYALAKHVIPVSPNSFYAYLQTILLGLRGMKINEESRAILDGIGRVRKEFDIFSETFRVVGQHLDNSTKKYAEAQKRFTIVEAKMEQMTGLDKSVPQLPDGAAR